MLDHVDKKTDFMNINKAINGYSYKIIKYAIRKRLSAMHFKTHVIKWEKKIKVI